MARGVWVRPELPAKHQGPGPLYALLMFLISVGLMMWPLFWGASGSGYTDEYGIRDYSEPNGLAILMLYAVAAPLSFVFFLFGLVIISVSYVLREIRQAAYEAAIRAGEAAPE